MTKASNLEIQNWSPSQYIRQRACFLLVRTMYLDHRQCDTKSSSDWVEKKAVAPADWLPSAKPSFLDTAGQHATILF